jgi:hypothetical protein
MMHLLFGGINAATITNTIYAIGYNSGSVIATRMANDGTEHWTY